MQDKTLNTQQVESYTEISASANSSTLGRQNRSGFDSLNTASIVSAPNNIVKVRQTSSRNFKLIADSIMIGIDVFCVVYKGYTRNKAQTCVGPRL